MKQTASWVLPAVTIAAAVVLGLAVVVAISEMSSSLARRIPTVISDRPLQSSQVAAAAPASGNVRPAPASTPRATADSSGVNAQHDGTSSSAPRASARGGSKEEPDESGASGAVRSEPDAADESHEVVRPRLREQDDSDAEDVTSQATGKAEHDSADDSSDDSHPTSPEQSTDAKVREETHAPHPAANNGSKRETGRGAKKAARHANDSRTASESD